MAKKKSLKEKKDLSKKQGLHIFKKKRGEKEDSKTVEILKTEEPYIELGSSSIIGTRTSQQDSIFAYRNDNEAIGIVCDGMGGLEGGELASRTAVKSLTDAWFAKNENEDIMTFLREEAYKADEKVFSLQNGDGERLDAGSTIVVAIIQDRNQLYWLSIGDSKIYIIRGTEILSVCRQHNYRLTLDRQLEAGTITPEKYKAEECNAEALISYLGMGNVSLMDVNREPFSLEDRDIILLCSDGLYKSLTEEQILAIIKGNDINMQVLADTLTAQALGDKQSGQDNTSVVVLQYCLR